MTDVRKYGKMPYLVLLRKVEKWSWIQMDQHQNLIAFRGSLLAHAYQIWSTSINGFLSYHADRPTHTRVITIPAALLLYRRSGKITETPPQRRIVFVVFGKDVFSFHLNVFSNRLIAQGPWKKCKNSTVRLTSVLLLHSVNADCSHFYTVTEGIELLIIDEPQHSALFFI